MVLKPILMLVQVRYQMKGLSEASISEKAQDLHFFTEPSMGNPTRLVLFFLGPGICLKNYGKGKLNNFSVSYEEKLYLHILIISATSFDRCT